MLREIAARLEELTAMIRQTINCENPGSNTNKINRCNYRKEYNILLLIQHLLMEVDDVSITYMQEIKAFDSLVSRRLYNRKAK